MAKKKTEEIVKELVLPIVSKYKYQLVDIEFKKEGPNWFLRIYIDKTGGVNLEDCQIVSDNLGAILDELDPIQQSYILEVSSPGIDRPLKTSEDYERYKDHKIEIKLYSPFNSKKNYIGQLIGLKDNNINIIENNSKEIIEIPLKSASSVRLHVEF